MQFGFEEGVGCIEASVTILKTINHMLERGSKVFGCFFDVRKAFDMVWVDGLSYKLFKGLGIEGNMWLAIKDLYTDVMYVKFWWHACLPALLFGSELFILTSSQLLKLERCHGF